MASTYSPSLRIQLIETGTENEAWGQPLDNNLGTIIEQAITGVNSISLTNLTTYTLTAGNAVVDQARNAVLVFTGALSANCNVVAPAVKKVYVVSNQTTGGKNISITVGSGSNVAVANGTNQLVYCNGTSFKSAVDVNSIIGNLDVSGSSSVGGNVTVSGGTIFGSGNITTTNGNLTLRSTTSNVVNFQGSTGALIPPFGSTAQRPASPQVGMSRWNTDLGVYEIWNGIIWQQITGSYNVFYLVAAGGGGGGTTAAGGGGAGGLLTGAFNVAPNASYTVTVGAGGAASASGSNSSSFSVTPVGGGRGGDGGVVGTAGGSGGGGGGGQESDPPGVIGKNGGSGTSGQGNGGGKGGDILGGSDLAGGGGGGGAGATGSGGANANIGNANGGAGGAGAFSSITGSAVAYAGGGGGGPGNGTGGAGGVGGGGAGGTGTRGAPGNGNPGTANRGGGGGGGTWNGTGGAGGSGVVILSYANAVQRATGGTVTSYSAGGNTYWVHTFTTSGTFVT
jgi:hypothetical protein